MITSSISETRRNLAQLIEKARAGEDVVIIKDSRPVAALRAITAEDLELKLEVSDAQARKLWNTLNEADLVSFDAPDKAVKHLKRRGRSRK
ncbi:MAG TPA: type II toxin-antitoxin system prevent-host-death family antitoxin [Planctomycetaceae bacterium]|nr:type II toxin-antitoxin system prevent-host-death family antitoxin [Planctomycetaceae bacterium]